MRNLSIDIETYSAVDLTRSTVYRYSEDPSFEILLIGYAFDDDPVTVIDVKRGDPIPEEFIKALTDMTVNKHAYNANFERVCLSRLVYSDKSKFLNPTGWYCTMVQAMTCGLPRSLADVGRALGLPEDKQKMKEGKQLIQYFCKPCNPTKSNGGRTRNLPEHDPAKWATFVEYNRQDVEAERAIGKYLGDPDDSMEIAAYWLDQRVNDRGVLCDAKLVQKALEISREHTAALTEEAVSISGLNNPNSVAQLKDWLGVEGSLNKKTVKEMRDSGTLGRKQDRLLAIRQEMGKTSISKYEAMERGMCRDNRVRGLFQFYGANRTGRWAGRQVQVQNLPQNKIPDLDTARSIVLEGSRDELQCLFGNVPDTLSQLIRTAFIAGDGKVFAVADFSAIEARVVAWLSGEQWRMDVFREGQDIYCASASQMFRVPVKKHGINGHLRQKGKIAELALGYGGSVGALKQMGALEMGLTEDELQPIVDAWRATNPHVTQLWWDVDRLVRDAIRDRGIVKTMYVANGARKITAYRAMKALCIELPSGRKIRYFEPELTYDPVTGRENITYAGMEVGKWGRVETYGPKLVENIVQATARDCLRDAMLNVNFRYAGIVMHVHDEMIVEVPEEQAKEALDYMEECMSKPISWAPGLLLRGDGYITRYYRKD